MDPEHRPAIRAASWATLAVGLIAFINPHITAPGEWAAIWGGWLTGGTLMLFSIIHIWTARSGRPLFGSRMLSMFNVMVAAVLLLHGFVLRLNPAYAWTAAILGAVVMLVEGFDAVVSPGSRWMRVNPRD